MYQCNGADRPEIRGPSNLFDTVQVSWTFTPQQNYYIQNTPFSSSATSPPQYNMLITISFPWSSNDIYIKIFTVTPCHSLEREIIHTIHKLFLIFICTGKFIARFPEVSWLNLFLDINHKQTYTGPKPNTEPRFLHQPFRAAIPFTVPYL